MPFLTASGHRLHYEWIGPGPDAAPTIVFLHHGLGSVETWLDYPQSLCEAAGCGGLIYSRWGHGQSDPVSSTPHPLDFMETEARQSLPEVLQELDIRQPILVGHSDGGSIALLYAAGDVALPPAAIVTVAAHVFFDRHSLAGMTAGRKEWDAGDLRAGLRRYHGDNTESVYLAWSGLWLTPEALDWNIEDQLPKITCPALVIQGSEDAFGLEAQVDAIVDQVRGPVRRLVLPGIGHEPHREAKEATLAAMASFIETVLSARA
ncbi:MAG: alpha/beta fold hydrolase, partial [Alphaproteobacteria bacterium]